MPSLDEKSPLAAEERVSNVSATESYPFSVSVVQVQDEAFLTWRQDCPARLTESWVALYRGPFPKDPNNGHLAWAWATPNSGSFNTKQKWAPGLCAALVAKNSAGQWAYVVQTPET